MKRAVLLLLALASSAALGQGEAPMPATATASSLGVPTLTGNNVFTGTNRFSNTVGIDQGQKLAFDGLTAAKYYSSDGTSLTLTSLSFSGGSITGTQLGSTGVVYNNNGENTIGSPISRLGAGSGSLTQNSSTGETTLYSNTNWNSASMSGVVTPGKNVRFTMSGTFAANANAKTVKFKFGSQDVLGGLFTGTFNGTGWYVDCLIIRNASDAAELSWCNFGDSTNLNKVGFMTVLTQDLTAQVNLTLTGTGGATGDIVAKFFSSTRMN